MRKANGGIQRKRETERGGGREISTMNASTENNGRVSFFIEKHLRGTLFITKVEEVTPINSVRVPLLISKIQEKTSK